MTKIPDTTGDTYADIVTWRWDRNRMRWVSKLRDGTLLVVALQHFGHRTFWNASIDGVMLPTNPFKHPDAAEKAAVEAYKARQEFYAPEEDT